MQRTLGIPAICLIAALAALGCGGGEPGLPEAPAVDAGPVCSPDRCAQPACAADPVCTECGGACGPCTACVAGRCEAANEMDACGASGRCVAGACCEGCVTSEGTCASGDEGDACGLGGLACTACSGEASCREGVCRMSPLPDVRAGGLHTCVVAESGEVACAGDNSLGQLGTAASEDAMSFTPVLDAQRSVGAGFSHTCFLSDTGVLSCAGANNLGQLGTGDHADHVAPTPVKSTERFRSVAAGQGHTCAISVPGQLFCWGNNWNGELGLGDTGARNEPARVGIDTDWRSVSVGAGHTCAIKGDAGDLLCWGQNQLVQVGDGMTQPLGIPYRIGRGYAHVAAGDGFTCAVDREGSVSCWGQNHVGQLGLGGGDRRLRRVPTRVPVAEAIDAIATGSGHACALTRDQRILCWGDNAHGELGVGDTEPRDTPVPVTAPDHGWVTVSAGADHTCALGTDGAFRCWGGNRMGALGDGTGDDQPLPTEIDLSR